MTSSQIPDQPKPPEYEVHSFEELLSTGLLWLINATCLHPRGYALALNIGPDGKVTGWQMLGDSSEPWRFACDDETQAVVDERFASVKALLP